MLRILDLNLNGIRSAANKGFFDWLATQQADIVCVQELKAQLAECRDKALEEAAEACLSRIGEDDSGNAQAMNCEAMDCAEAIRSLKGTKP